MVPKKVVQLGGGTKRVQGKAVQYPIRADIGRSSLAEGNCHEEIGGKRRKTRAATGMNKELRR